MPISEVKRFGEHENAFGFLRLLFASLVIVSHTIEVHDGNARREPLTRLFGTITFGQFAVAGFFLISGFLITASYLKSPSPADYMRKRITRIYPGFIICSVICMVAFGPLGGGDPPVGVKHAVIAPIIRALILCPPVMDNVFLGSHYAHLNGAAWTIQYELLCYIVVLALGTLGMIDKPIIIIVLSALCLVLTSAAPQGISEFLNSLPLGSLVFQGDRIAIIRLTGLFLAGSSFYLIQHLIPISRAAAATSAVLLCGTLSYQPLVYLGMAVFGSYLIFAVAAFGTGTVLEKINNKNDISYGLYLYAWPIGLLLLWWHVSSSLWIIGGLTMLIASAAGAVSWFIVEKPA
ncbi:MAG: acyltransferase, partial [Cytophagaceae bacterium]